MNRNLQLWKVRDKRQFLSSVMKELAGAAHISFEGNLSVTQLMQLDDASSDETEVLKRNTIAPKQDFVVLPLEAESVEAVSAAIGGTVPRAILHIQIEKAGLLQWSACDNFAPNATYFGSAMTPEFLEKLESQGLLKKWAER